MYIHLSSSLLSMSMYECLKGSPIVFAKERSRNLSKKATLEVKACFGPEILLNLWGSIYGFRLAGEFG